MHYLGDQEVTSVAMTREVTLSLSLSSCYHCLSVRTCQTDTLQCQILVQDGYVVIRFFGGFYLLIQVMSLSEVTQVGFFVGGHSGHYQ